jgi:hypothetical protein
VAAVHLTNRPANVVGHSVHVGVFGIDLATRNYYATPATDPAHADLQQVASRTFTPGASYTATLDLKPNAIYLVQLQV